MPPAGRFKERKRLMYNDAYAIVVKYNNYVNVYAIYMTLKDAKKGLLVLAEACKNPEWTNKFKTCFIDDDGYRNYIQPTWIQK